ncbi:MAG: hypothetical protein RIB32_01165 [Phycisphaerales bacterium]
MGGSFAGILEVLLIAVLGTVALVAGVYLFFKLFGLVWTILGNIFRFIGAEISDAVRLIGTVIAAPIFALLVGLNVIIGRWSAAGHFGRSFGGECRAAGACVYRLLLSNPLKLFGLGGVLEGVEQRVPRAMAEAPGRDKPSKKRVGMFEGYTVVGSLKGGGSGGKLYIARPDELKRAALARRDAGDVDQVVIKVFSQKDGSTLDQILRESRALEAARRLGLVLEHSSEPDRFYYVMRYVPGESLGVMTQRMHAACAADGLDSRRLDEALGYISDLVAALHTYHQGGLWHKDVKPDNIIIDNPGTPHARAHLVDLGLVTPMRSAMTLTTHGTEYFRDPELVRQALRGVKVHQIDGAKFDVYSAGAVLFSVIENSFPAHGGLSQVTKKCPEALKWVIRRAMAEYDNRYPTAAMMLADLDVIRTAENPHTLKPADLPSMKGGPVPEPRAPMPPMPAMPAEPARVAKAASPVPPERGDRAAPKIALASWWSGRYQVSNSGAERGSGFVFKADVGRGIPADHVPTQAEAAATPIPPRREPGERAPAHEQVKQARERARVRRERAHQRISHRRAALKNPKGTRAGLAGAIVAFLILFAAAAGIAAFVTNDHSATNRGSIVIEHNDDTWDSEELNDREFWYGVDLDESDELVATVLVVSDLASPMDPGLDEQLAHGFGDLRSLGLVFAGDLVKGSTIDADRSIGLVAEARSSRGTLPIDTGELHDRLSQFLETAADVDAVLWLAPFEKRGEGVSLALVTRGGHWYTSVESGRAGETLVRALLENRDAL